MSAPQSVARIIGILETLCVRREPVSLAELSRSLETPKSSLSGLLSGLCELGLVAADSGTWRLAPGAFGLGSALLEARRELQTSDLIRQTMQHLAKLSGETVLFAVADEGGETLTYVDVVESRNSVRFSVAIGDRRPLYCTAAGRALLASLPEHQLDGYLRNLKPKNLTSRTVTSKRELAVRIRDAQERGVAQTIDQASEGVTGTAAVVRDAGGMVLGALTVAAPTERAAKLHEELARIVRDEADACSRVLGYRAAADLTP
jgi:DNA-binding IclR family transcriptional regulator